MVQEQEPLGQEQKPWQPEENQRPAVASVAGKKRKKKKLGRRFDGLGGENAGATDLLFLKTITYTYSARFYRDLGESLVLGQEERASSMLAELVAWGRLSPALRIVQIGKTVPPEVKRSVVDVAYGKDEAVKLIKLMSVEHPRFTRLQHLAFLSTRARLDDAPESLAEQVASGFVAGSAFLHGVYALYVFAREAVSKQQKEAPLGTTEQLLLQNNPYPVSPERAYAVLLVSFNKALWNTLEYLAGELLRTLEEEG